MRNQVEPSGTRTMSEQEKRLIDSYLDAFHSRDPHFMAALEVRDASFDRPPYELAWANAILQESAQVFGKDKQ